MWLCVRYEGQWLLSLGKLTIQWCDWRWKICTTQHFTPVYPIKSPYSAYFVLLFLQCMAPDCDWLYASVWLCLPHSLAPSARSFCQVMRTSSYSSTFLLCAPWIVAAADPGIIWHLSIWTGWKPGFTSYLVPVLSFCVFCQVSKKLVAWNLLVALGKCKKKKKKSNRSNYFWRLRLLGYVKFNAVHQGIMHVFKSLILYNQDNSNMLM